MKLSKFDIGADVISIITKGMYPDPKDALREYIQNGVDALAKKINVKIRQESIVVEDDGHGMNHDVLRKAVRVGISDKNPSKNVGFLGIGIYSAFHLCDKLTIYSRGSENISNRLEMDFGGMKSVLIIQKDKRLSNNIKSEELIDLQTLLESYISLTDNGDFLDSSYPIRGTRVELSNIEPEFYSALSEFNEVANYLRNVIPLKFDQEKFSYGEMIEKEITKICEEHYQKFEIISLTLQVNSKIEELFRPYKDSDFSKIAKPLAPQFYPIRSNDEFFGVTWGCLSAVRRKLDNKSIRGFILKKQGFSIGKRENLLKFFRRGNTFFDRYSGEVIIVNTNILPNTSRNDIEYSPLRTIFYEVLAFIADKFDEFGNQYQEHTKGDEELGIIRDLIKQLLSAYNEYETDPDKLVDQIVLLKNIHDRLSGRIVRKGFSEDSEKKATALLDQVIAFQSTIQQRIKVLTENKKKKQNEATASKTEIAKNVAEIKLDVESTQKNFENLYDLLNDLEYKLDDDLKEVIFTIDEMFIQRVAKTKTEYYELLQQLKDSIQNS